MLSPNGAPWFYSQGVSVLVRLPEVVGSIPTRRPAQHSGITLLSPHIIRYVSLQPALWLVLPYCMRVLGDCGSLGVSGFRGTSTITSPPIISSIYFMPKHFFNIFLLARLFNKFDLHYLVNILIPLPLLHPSFFASFTHAEVYGYLAPHFNIALSFPIN